MRQIIGLAVALLVVLGIFRCTASTAQTEACLSRTDAAMVAEAQQRCHGYTWAECPVKEEIKAKYVAERHRCP